MYYTIIFVTPFATPTPLVTSRNVIPPLARSFVYFTRGPALSLLVIGLLALLDVVIFYFG